MMMETMVVYGLTFFAVKVGMRIQEMKKTVIKPTYIKVVLHRTHLMINRTSIALNYLKSLKLKTKIAPNRDGVTRLMIQSAKLANKIPKWLLEIMPTK